MHLTTWDSMALVRVTLCVERISFMIQRWIYCGKKSSFSGYFIFAARLVPILLVFGRNWVNFLANGSGDATLGALDAVHGACAAAPAVAGVAAGACVGTQSAR
jgi:hypothetical protein